MKTFLQAAGIFLIALLAFLFIAGWFSNTAQKTELENTLDTAVEHALYVAMSNNSYSISNTDELAADVMHELFSSCNVKADYTIAFNVIDINEGLVDVQVTQKIKSFPFIKSEIVCRRTVILEAPAG